MATDLLGQLLDHGLQPADTVSNQPAIRRRPGILIRKLLADAIEAAPDTPDAHIVCRSCIRAFHLASFAGPAAPRSLARFAPLETTSGVFTAVAVRCHGAVAEGRYEFGPSSSALPK